MQLLAWRNLPNAEYLQGARGVGSLVVVGSLVGMGSLVEYLINCKTKMSLFIKNIALYKKYLFEAFCTFEIQGYQIYDWVISQNSG